MSAGKLYLVATPIGNLADMTFRAVEVLQAVDRILAEDTRTTSVLLKHYNIQTPLSAFHQHNEHARLAGVIQELSQGAQMAQVSDAGTPGISDPGFLLARAALDAGIAVEVIPGATAFIPALLKSGFALHRFVFEGFLPQKKGRLTRMQQLAAETRTVVFYESPHKLLKTLEALQQLCGPDRRISVSREITKKFEETLTGPLSEIAAHFKTTAPRGEFVVVLEGLDNNKSDAE
ncbi:MAG: 16S rRNA (cytidine(1402)-2'-O)-methyltransferase [Bacteroidia bacterium]